MFIIFFLGLAIAAGTRALGKAMIVFGENRWQQHPLPLNEGKQNG